MTQAYRFGPFRLVTRQRLLLRDDHPVPLGGRAFDLLEALLQRHERIVTKDELIDTVWPGRVVEENNLQVQIVALRRALGSEAILTVPGRGYRFALPVQVEGTARHDIPKPPAEAAPDLIGRDQEFAQLSALLDMHLQVTLTGPAGIGKTRLAQAVRQARPRSAWIALAACRDAPALRAALVQALGSAGDAEPAALLRREPRLLVLDNAEHLVDEVTTLLTGLRMQVPGVPVLVTSQVPLRLPDEQVMQLGPLSLPTADGLAEAADSNAVKLFVARARAADRRFRLDTRNAAAVAEVCRRLDGIPLALELGASRVRLLGVHGLRERLDDRFALLTTGATASLPRHRTLRAAMDWSHALLSEAEQRVFRRLAVFAGSFGLAAAQTVCADATLDRWAVLDALGSLVDRSLVVTDGAEPPRYRLLESARLFAREHLDAAGESPDRLRRHAQATIDTLREAVAAWRRSGSGSPHRDQLRAELDNVRAACRWAERDADLALGIELAEAAGWSFSVLNLHAEYLAMAERWLARLPGEPDRRADDPAAAALCLRTASVSKNSAHPAGLTAALAAASHYRRQGDGRRLHECLICAVAIGARRGVALPFAEMLAEARALQRPDWSRASLSNFEWAHDTWLLSEGRYTEALAGHLAQVDRNLPYAALGAWQAAAANAAACLVALDRPTEACDLAERALAALSDGEAQVSVRGYVLAALAHARARLGEADAVAALAREALPLLAIEGDERILLLPLALAAEVQRRPRHAARLAGLHDHGVATTGVRPWPADAAAWRDLRARLHAALGAEELARESLYGAGRPLHLQLED